MGRNAQYSETNGNIEEGAPVSDNVIKFRKPKPVKQPRPGQRKLIVILAAVAAFLLMWGYFILTGQPAP